MWEQLAIGFALVLIIEGILPFAAPHKWRVMVMNVARQDDKSLRIFGFALMIMGTLLISYINA